MHHRNYIGALLACVVLILPVSGVAAPQSPLARNVDVVLEQAVAEQRIVGGVVQVAHKGKVVYSRAVGYADKEAHLPMREGAIFLLSSVTKPIVSMAAMRLVEQGKLSLDDEVTQTLPAFRPKRADGTEAAITIRQLLTHTSGLGYGFDEEWSIYDKAKISNGLDMSGLSLEENLTRLASVPLFSKPGEAWRYSLSMDVLGGVLAAVEQKPLPAVVKEQVTQPLGLQDTGFAVADKERFVKHYYNAKPEPRLIGEGEASPPYVIGRIFNPASYPSGGAGMAGTVPDFMRILLALRDDTLLSHASKQAMFTDYTEKMAATPGGGWGFGMGGAILVDAKEASTPQAEGTMQWGGIYGHYWFIDPVQDVTVVLFTNTTPEGMDGKLTQDLRHAVYAGVAEAQKM